MLKISIYFLNMTIYIGHLSQCIGLRNAAHNES
jgi:hypothetical protein